MPDSILDELRRVGKQRRGADLAAERRRGRERELVHEALALRISKAEIGRCLGISRQAVEQLARRDEMADRQITLQEAIAAE